MFIIIPFSFFLAGGACMGYLFVVNAWGGGGTVDHKEKKEAEEKGKRGGDRGACC